tara:strand:+ start:1512 stop:1643 length:132 start_codon:yes stop_codon:yes gene_type:complete
MDKLEKDINYTAVVDETSQDSQEILLKNIVNKINEIIDWINAQ